jgi:predicted alpha/beta-hydrolase family hydrolase
VLARFGSATEVPLRKQIAEVLFDKGSALARFGLDFAARAGRIDRPPGASEDHRAGGQAWLGRRRETSLTTPMEILEIPGETLEATHRFFREGWI